MIFRFFHSTQCKLETEAIPMPSPETNNNSSDSEVLISVQTVHTPANSTQNTTRSTVTANASDDSTTTQGPVATNSKFCFVCNAPSKDSFVKMFGTVSNYSKKSIYDFIWKFLDCKPSVRHETADASSLNDEMICSECFIMICDYDIARSNAKRLKKQIRQKLAITETYFEQKQNRMDATQTAAEDVDGEQQQQQQHPQHDDTMECDVIDLCDDD